MKFKRLLAILLIGVMILLTACGGNKSDGTNSESKSEGKTSDNDTLVIGLTDLNGIFNPIFATTANDNNVVGAVFTSVCSVNDNNELIDEAGSISYEEIKDDNGEAKQVKYTVKLKEDMTFSDGVPVTIDDVIFTYYLQADPAYDGMSTFSSLNIVGLKEYYYDTPNYESKMKEFEDISKNLSEEEISNFIKEFTDKEIKEKTPEVLNKELELGLDETDEDFLDKLSKAYLRINMEDESMIIKAKDAKYNQLKKDYVHLNLSDGIDVQEISGIQKVDELTCTILVNGVNIIADRALAGIIMPKHYYGIAEDGTEFKKGDMTVPKSRNSSPLGSGPYIFKNYDNNIVSLEANPSYFKGEPKTKNLKFQIVSESNKVDVVSNGEIDITDPSAQKEIMQRLDSEGIEYNLTDNNGYGYIGINAKRLPDINVRKGLMHLMNRKPSIQSYYGNLAEVLERPMTSTLAEYPQDAKEYYSYDKDKAIKYFEKAGYTKDSSGKLVDKNGKQLKIEIGIASLSSHPSAGILSQMKNDLTEIGVEFLISDLQFNVLTDRVRSGDIDMFSMAWGSSNHADFTQVYHSSSAEGSGSNYFNLKDQDVDKLIEEVAVTLDLEKRKELIAKELDLIMKNAVIMPVYQRKNLDIFNDENLNMDTVYRSNSPYYTYRNEYHLIEMK